MSLALFIKEFIDDFIRDPARNNLGSYGAGENSPCAWAEAAVTFSSGADPLYQDLKSHIGAFHWTPLEAFNLGLSECDAPLPESRGSIGPTDLTVVSLALSQTRETKAANRCQARYPSEPWARSRVFGQECSEFMQAGLVQALIERGHFAVAPGLLSCFGQSRSERYGRASYWSERHVAYISGLGTFGLAGGLITPLGQAVRLTSIVVHADIPATPREYDDPFAYCLHYAKGSCGMCAKRCPSGSVSLEGRDKEACAHHLRPVTAEYVRSEYGFDGYSCGLCQTRVPCESGIPPALRPRL